MPLQAVGEECVRDRRGACALHVEEMDLRTAHAHGVRGLPAPSRQAQQLMCVRLLNQQSGLAAERGRHHAVEADVASDIQEVRPRCQPQPARPSLQFTSARTTRARARQNPQQLALCALLHREQPPCRGGSAPLGAGTAGCEGEVDALNWRHSLCYFHVLSREACRKPCAPVARQIDNSRAPLLPLRRMRPQLWHRIKWPERCAGHCAARTGRQEHDTARASDVYMLGPICAPAQSANCDSQSADWTF